jgi:hypothetical protein
MTLIRSYQPYIDKKAVKTGVPVMGGVVSQMMASTTMLDKIKVLNRTHVNIMYNYLFRDLSGLIGVQSDIMTYSFTQSDPLHLFIPTSPEATHLAMIIKYYNTVNSEKNLTSASLRVEAFVISPSTTKIDEGFEMTHGSHLQLNGSGLYAVHTLEAFTGAEQFEPPSGGYTAATGPRPLYIPSAHRGKNIHIKMTAEYLNFAGVDVLELAVP